MTGKDTTRVWSLILALLVTVFLGVMKITGELVIPWVVVFLPLGVWIALVILPTILVLIILFIYVVAVLFADQRPPKY